MNDQPWYHRGLRFECTGCGACCIGAPGYVWVNKAEIEALASVLRLEVEQFEKRYVRQIGIRKSLVEFPNGDCVFFDNRSRGCQVYEVRPRQCRTWPFWASNLQTPETWQQTCRDCPGADHGPLASLREIRASLEVMHV
jgi:Fe-S-cluster containining protein